MAYRRGGLLSMLSAKRIDWRPSELRTQGQTKILCRGLRIWMLQGPSQNERLLCLRLPYLTVQKLKYLSTLFWNVMNVDMNWVLRFWSQLQGIPIWYLHSCGVRGI